MCALVIVVLVSVIKFNSILLLCFEYKLHSDESRVCCVQLLIMKDGERNHSMGSPQSEDQ